MFECVILAGGFGTRLKSISGEIPKPMVIISGVPFLYRLMKEVELQGCSKIILSLHYRADFIIECISRDKPVNCQVEFVVEEEPLGTGGALKRSAQFVSSEKFIVLNGDTYQEIDLMDFYNTEGAGLIMSAVEVPDVFRYGALCIDNNQRVLKMLPKGQRFAGLINSGTYLIRVADILSFPMEIFSFETDFIPEFEGNIRAYLRTRDFVDIGVPEDFYAACKRFT